jgi:hypothetical protein
MIRAIWRPLVLIGMALSAMAPLPSVAAQDDEILPVTPGAGQYLPATVDLGPNWVDVWQSGIDPGAELFKEGVKAVCGGPDGSRAIVYA